MGAGKEVRLASDFSYFGRKPIALHVCKRSVGKEGVGARRRSQVRDVGVMGGRWRKDL